MSRPKPIIDQPFQDSRGRTIQLGSQIQWVKGRIIADGIVVSIGPKNLRVQIRGRKNLSIVPRESAWEFRVGDYVQPRRDRRR